jgi:hypothetical protein
MGQRCAICDEPINDVDDVVILCRYVDGDLVRRHLHLGCSILGRVTIEACPVCRDTGWVVLSEDVSSSSVDIRPCPQGCRPRSEPPVMPPA